MLKDKDTLIHLYYQMLRIRVFEEKIADLYKEQKMRCPVHLCIGQEAVAVGICSQLRRRDYILSTHRSHGHYLSKGGDMKAMIAEIYGKHTGCSKGKGGSMHLIDLDSGFLGSTSIVSGTIPVAVGVAFGTKMKKNDAVTVVFFGDAAIEEGTFHESMNFASLHKLPILFVCENNMFSTYSHISKRQPKRDIFEMARGYGVKSLAAEGNDIIQVWNTGSEALNEIRNSGGPAFIEFKTYRWREHCGPNYDLDIGYREPAEVNYWRSKCPIKSLYNYLLEEKIISENDSSDIIKKIKDEVDDAFDFADRSSFPGKEELFKHIFSGEY